MSMADDEYHATADAIRQAGHRCDIGGRTVECLIEPQLFTPTVGGGMLKDMRQGTLHVLAESLDNKRPDGDTVIVIEKERCEVETVTDTFGVAYHIEFRGAAQ